jgi:hypothetical protein
LHLVILPLCWPIVFVISLVVVLSAAPSFLSVGVLALPLRLPKRCAPLPSCLRWSACGPALALLSLAFLVVRCPGVLSRLCSPVSPPLVLGSRRVSARWLLRFPVSPGLLVGGGRGPCVLCLWCGSWRCRWLRRWSGFSCPVGLSWGCGLSCPFSALWCPCGPLCCLRPCCCRLWSWPWSGCLPCLSLSLRSRAFAVPVHVLLRLGFRVLGQCRIGRWSWGPCHCVWCPPVFPSCVVGVLVPCCCIWSLVFWFPSVSVRYSAFAFFLIIFISSLAIMYHI